MDNNTASSDTKKVVEEISHETEIAVPHPLQRRPHGMMIAMGFFFVLVVMGAFFAGGKFLGAKESMQQEEKVIEVAKEISNQASVSEEVSSKVDPTAEWETYVFSESGITFKYPSEYLLGSEAKKGFEEVSFGKTKEEVAGLKKCFISGQKPECSKYALDVNIMMGLKKDFPTIQDFMTSTIPDVSQFRPTTFQIYEAFSYEESDDSSATKRIFVDLKSYYVMITINSNADIQANKKYFDQILNTFAFSDTKPSEGDLKTTYSDTTYNFSFTIPNGYFTEVKDYSENDERLVHIKKTDAPIFGYIFTVKPNWDNTGNAKSLDRNFSVGGVPASRVDPPTKEERSLSLYQTNVYFEHGGRVYVFTCGHNWVDDYVKACDGILSSFVFSK